MVIMLQRNFTMLRKLLLLDNSTILKVLQNNIRNTTLSEIRCSHRLSCSVNAASARYSSSSRGVNWDNFGIWGNRIEEPILLQQSIKHGIPIPKISVGRIGKESLTGRRAENEDRICIKELRPNLLYVGIFDGHAGSMAVDYVHHNLEFHLNFWLEREYDLQIVLKKAFEDLNNKLTRYLYIHYPEPEHEHSGSTATVALLRNGNELVLGNLGDSRAILCRNGKALRLTNDHDPEYNTKEKERIKASDGYITWNSLGKPLVNGILTMTRSFGDVTLKRYGVIATPETRSLEVKHGRDSFLVFCTDGVHFVMNDQEMCDSISLCHNAHEAASFICDQALQFGSEDNASVIVVPLGQWGRDNGPTLIHSLRWQGRSGA
ncbi:protein phosphatase 1K, mitochondrial-like isoform X2 [Lytechinus variegatus]|nr:protein phosphatase 1K, mitochondrial-like isoform X2 [Lytechinus variegatus]XP_041486053.1 protein phosphatase 1K, mitochondrial-like isoform X2 [Lytechinus variegatus]